MDGVLVIDKPRGCTSFDVVQRVRRALRTKKAGHTGTLDPMATGVLPVCVGVATRIAGHITLGEKAYEGELRFGAETDTLDADGQVVAEAPVPPGLDEATVEAALARFRGTYLQTPPMYSAVKVGGKRLYELAREGVEVERPAREVTVHELTLRGLRVTVDEGARLRFYVRCSKGFFVRTLAQELGRALGTLAHLTALRRTKVGPFTIDQAIPLAQLEADPSIAAGRLVTESAALAELTPLHVSEQDAVKVRHGQQLPGGGRPAGERLRVMGPDDALLALAEVAETGRLRYLRVLAGEG